MPGDKAFDYINSIFENKGYLWDEDAEKNYQPFLAIRAVSLHIDGILYANELNQCQDLPKKMHYDYLFHAIRKMKRKFAKWPKKAKDEDILKIMEYYNVSRQKALDYATILTKTQIKELYARTDKGGLKSRG